MSTTVDAANNLHLVQRVAAEAAPHSVRHIALPNSGPSASGASPQTAMLEATLHMTSRPATHAGKWYVADPAQLARQIGAYFAAAPQTVPRARVLVGPHAGYTFSGARLAETFRAWDTRGAKRVFVLGPSHHVYFKDTALVTAFSSYETPLGTLEVDTAVCSHLTHFRGASGRAAFAYMSTSVDEDEHSFEMHAPFIAHRCNEDGVQVKIVPIMVSGLGHRLKRDIVEALTPYLQSPENTFVVSSDFCHWGLRFGYTKYVPKNDIGECGAYSSSRARGNNPIYKSIETLDRAAMDVAAQGSLGRWDDYIAATGNTICGQKPISIVLALVERVQKGCGFHWIGYSQSSQVTLPYDLSVSYASGYIQLND